MYTEDFIANIHGVLYHETLPKGHKKIDVKVFEEKKKTRQTDSQNTTVATLELKLDEENHCIYAKVEDIISSGTSITTHDKQQCHQCLPRLLETVLKTNVHLGLTQHC